MSDDDNRYGRGAGGRAVALGTAPRPDALEASWRSVEREPDITGERGLARTSDVIVTETYTEVYDESDGTSRVRHAGEDPEVHHALLTERAHYQRHRVSEEQRSRRLLATLASALLLGSAALLALAPDSTNVYLGAALLLVAAGAFGIKSFRIRVKDLELGGGEGARPADPR